MNNAHSNASAAVRSFNHKTRVVASTFTQDKNGKLLYEVDPTKKHTLRFPTELDKLGWLIEVRFAEVLGYSGMIRISATNWRCEDEPNGLYTKIDARKFYAELLRLGFKPYTYIPPTTPTNATGETK